MGCASEHPTIFMTERRTITRKEFLLYMGGGLVALLGAGGIKTLVDLANAPEESAPSDELSSVSAESFEAVVARFEPEPSLRVDFTSQPDGTQLDPNIWGYELGTVVPGYNNEAQTYTNRPENVRVENGMLVIQARKEQLDGREYTSARINTKNKRNIQYGRVEVEAQLPKGIGTWPAFWLRTSDTPYTDGATAEEREAPNFHIQNGEIDFMEAIPGNRPGLIFANAHTYQTKSTESNANQGVAEVPDCSEAFHRYGVAWSPDEIVFMVDDVIYKRVQRTSNDPHSWPFNHDFNLVINLAMGGDWPVKNGALQGFPYENGINDADEEFWKLYVKSVKIWDLLPAA